MNKYDKLFLNHAQYDKYYDYYLTYTDKKKWREHKWQLYKRRNSMYKHFKFTKRNITRLNQINKMLREKERKAFQLARQYETTVLKQMNTNKFISDYEIDFEIALFSDKKYKNIEDMLGNPFYTDKYALHFFKKDSIVQSDKEETEKCRLSNHNDLGEKHPLYGQNHCALFHHLYDHTYLAWKDIIEVEEIWIEVILRLQNIQMVKNTLIK